MTASNPKAAWWAYFLRCADGTLYCGATNDRARRLARHSRGQVKYTRGRLPVEMVWSRRCRDKSAALKLEVRLKRLDRRAKLALVAKRR